MGDIATVNQALPAHLKQAIGGRTGMEDASNECFAIPFLRVAQKPAQNDNPALKAGMFFNTATGAIYGNEITLIPLHFSRAWVEWEGKFPNAKYKGTISPAEFRKTLESQAAREGSEMVIGTRRFVDNRNFIVLNANAPQDGIMLFGLKSTGIPASKKWLSSIAGVRIKGADGSFQQPACWTKAWTLTTISKTFPSGPAFIIDAIRDAGWIKADLVGVAEAAFEEAQGYAHATVVDPEDEVPKDW